MATQPPPMAATIGGGYISMRLVHAACMIAEGLTPRGLHPKSAMPDQASPAPRRLGIEWTAQL